ncbi:MAG: hypothetical protein JNM18_09715 [Planctomycetaceae bacterium]|nr:hypothetical protein [Planctomycetaceae bacterium]
MISCDDVFMVLTRGPFPTGHSSDAVVEGHLNHCASCRQLAEALRPIDELVPEMVAPEESRSLPSYAGPVHSIEPRVLSAVLAEFDYGVTHPRRLQQLRLAVATRQRSIPWGGICAFLGAVSVGLSLTVLYYGLTGQLQQRLDPRPAAAAVERD